MRIAVRAFLLIGAVLISSPAAARVLKVIDWQGAVYRVTHTDKRGNFDQDTNYAYVIYDYEAVSNAMSVGYDRALRANAEAVASGKLALFCPPARRPDLRSDEINRYFDTLPMDYRKKATAVEAMVGFAIQRFPCTHTP